MIFCLLLYQDKSRIWAKLYVDPSGENAIDMAMDTIRQIANKAAAAAKDAWVSEDVVDAVSDFSEWVAAWDYIEDPNGRQMAWQIVGWELPGVWTVADARDWTAAVDNCEWAWCIWDVGWASLWFVPFIGSLKHLKKADEIVDIAKNIWKWHGFTKHIDEFADVWVDSVEWYTKHIEDVMTKAQWTDNHKVLERWRSAYWDDDTASVVIHNPNDPDCGSCFVPDNGKSYFFNDIK